MVNYLQWLKQVLFPLLPPARRERRRVIAPPIEVTAARDYSAQSDAVKLLVQVSAYDASQALARLGATENGLMESQVKLLIAQHGANEIEHERHPGWLRQLASAYNHPFNLLLSALALISYVTEDLKATILLLAMVVLSATLRFFQEYRSSKAAEKLRAMVRTTATVKRIDDVNAAAMQYAQTVGLNISRLGRETREIAITELVPGDVIKLSAGDMVPADVRLLAAKDLFVSQAALTGESFPVEKTAGAVHHSPDNVLDRPNLCFMGTNVVSGSATALVVNTGAATFFGSLSRSVVGQREPTEFDRGVQRVSWLLIRFMLVMVPFVFLINGVTKHDWAQAFVFAVAIAVGLTPEMLPMVVTATLARGAVAMSRRKVIVKKLNAIQNFGAMDVLCTDKTGTLTQDNIVLERHVDLRGEESEEVLRHAFLNSYYQTGLKNLLDVAILKHGEVLHELNLPQNYRLVDEIPFDFSRRRMSVVVAERDDHHELICKGAVDEMLSICTSVKLDGNVVALDEALREQALMLDKAFSEDGFRVIAVAYKELPASSGAYSVQDEAAMMLLGFIAFLDPPKESAGPAIRALATHGVSVKILTGDNEIVTRNICGHVGIDADRIVLGSEIAEMTKAELRDAAEQATIFAKLTPAQKDRIVRALQEHGHVVGFLGDGINDSPALRAADIGISVDTAVDIAKESADIILLEKSLLVLEEGVIEGRRTFGNIVKYIKMAASSNFGNVFSVLGASTLLPFLPMLPLQLLTQNLLYDVSQTAIPFDEMDKEYTEKPRKWEIGSLARFMLFIGPVSSLFDYATFAVMWFVFGARTAGEQSLFQSGWFIEGLLSQTLIVHIIRTSRMPFFESRAALPLLVMTAAVMAIGICIPFSPIAPVLGLRPLPATYFAWLLAILIAYAMLTQLVKRQFVRRYGFI